MQLGFEFGSIWVEKTRCFLANNSITHVINVLNLKILGLNDTQLKCSLKRSFYWNAISASRSADNEGHGNNEGQREDESLSRTALEW
jgi:hypothetical protein